MTYNSDHLAWKQRLNHEKLSAIKQLEKSKEFQNIGDYYNYMIDQEQQVNEMNKKMPVYQIPLYAPQDRALTARRRSDQQGDWLYNQSQTPRIGIQKKIGLYDKVNTVTSPFEKKRFNFDNPEEQREVKKGFLAKQAYVKRQNSTAALSTKSSKKILMKTLYPTEKPKQNLLPKIQRFNEDVDALSILSKQKVNEDNHDTQSQLATLLSKVKAQASAGGQVDLKLPNGNFNNYGDDEDCDKVDDSEYQSELQDEINSLYHNNELKNDDQKSTASSKAKSTISKTSQVIISSLQKQLEQEKEARKKLEEELQSIKQLSLQLIKNAQLQQKNQ